MSDVPVSAPRVKVALFGAGARGLQCLAALADDARFEITGFFDNDPRKWRTTIDGLPVLEPTAAACGAVDAIIVASMSRWWPAPGPGPATSASAAAASPTWPRRGRWAWPR